MTNLQQAIIADDLTGACDAAVPWALRGWRTWVTWRPTDLGDSSAEGIGICTNSRTDDPTIAANAARHAARSLQQRRVARILKKIDSTLKGNWVHETLAVLDELSRSAAVIAPAFPTMGRRIVNGKLRLSTTASSESPSVLVTLRDQCGLAACHVSCHDLRKGATNLADFVALRCDGTRVFVVDSEVDADLDVVAESVELLGERVLPVGSAGLAASLARLANRPAGGTRRSSHQSEMARAVILPSSSSLPVVLFVGSTNPQTDAQVNALGSAESTGEYDMSRVSMAEFGAGLKCGKHLIVRIGWDKGHLLVMDHVLEACQREGVAGFVLTGGDTAQLFCDRAAARGIWIEGEIASGIPWGRISGGPFDRQLVATKAGGFGEPDALLRMVSFVSGLPHSDTFASQFRDPFPSQL